MAPATYTSSATTGTLTTNHSGLYIGIGILVGAIVLGALLFATCHIPTCERMKSCLWNPCCEVYCVCDECMKK